MPPYMSVARPFLLTAPNPIQASALELSSLILPSATVYPFTSFFPAELWTILVAIRSLLPWMLGDSRAAFSVLEDFNSAHPIVSDIFNWLVLAVRLGHRISFCWVPTHVSVKGNEEADKLLRCQMTSMLQHHDLLSRINQSILRFRVDDVIRYCMDN